MLTPNLDLKLVCKDGELQLAILDCTGSYDDPLNLGGFGTPNTETSEVLTTTLQIMFPSGDVYVLDTSADLPNLEGETLYYTYEQITGGTGEFVDGQYSFLYTLEADELSGLQTYTFEYLGLFFPNAECWVDNQLINLDLDSCAYFDKKYTHIKEVLFVSTLIDALGVHSCLGEADKFDNTLNTLNIYKDNNFDCKTC